MALFVDGPASTIDDLTDQDSGLLEVAQTNGVNLSTKLRLALDEIRTDLELWLMKPRPTIGEIWSPALRVEQIVVNPALTRWETLHALTLVYRDVYFTQVVDRYQAKWQGYKELAGDARESFLAGGLPAVNDPIHRAAPPVLIATPSSGAAGGTFYASVAWVNAAGQAGAASEAASMTVGGGNVMIVAAVNPPSNAAGFLVYAGTALNAMVLQSSVGLPVTSTYAYLPGQITAGPLPGCGQNPDFVRPVARTILRG
jgi:hypothetical protein